jgi:hypothetical protein
MWKPAVSEDDKYPIIDGGFGCQGKIFTRVVVLSANLSILNPLPESSSAPCGGILTPVL